MHILPIYIYCVNVLLKYLIKYFILLPGLLSKVIVSVIDYFQNKCNHKYHNHNRNHKNSK